MTIDIQVSDPERLAVLRAALLAATRHTLEQITGALRRIAEGTYGRCRQCETPIPAERLEVLPRAQYCVPCQQEQNG